MEDRRASGSRSPSANASAYSVKQNVPSVYRQPDLTGAAVNAVKPSSDDALASHASFKSKGDVDGTGVRRPSGPSSMETFPSANGGNMIGLSNSGLGGDRASIPRDESTLEVLPILLI